MFIAIDGNEANTKEKVGVSTYAFEIIWGLYRLNQKSKNPDKFLIYLKKDPNADLPAENVYWEYGIIKGDKNWILKNLTPALFKKPWPDVFFTPTHYLPPFAPVAKVFTLHDLGYLEFSDQFKKYDYWQLKYWTAISLYISKHIITVSQATRNDILRHYPFAFKKTSVIYHGYNADRFNSKIDKYIVRQVKYKYKIPSDYILFLSTLKPSKNIEGLLDGFSLIKKDFPNYKLVVAGKKGWLYESIYKKVENLGLENNVVFTDYVSEEDKPALFTGAKLFVLPSFWEGFGIDVLNALSCGTPVVISRVASLPEVAGKAGVYIDPYDPSSIASAMKEVLTFNDVKYSKLKKVGFEQVKKFSWDKSAEKTMEVFKKVL